MNLFPQTNASGDHGWRVMCFNVRVSIARDGDNAWPHRRELLLRTIKAFDPDLLGAQECFPDQVAFLREHLDGHGFVGVGRADGDAGGEFVPIFYRDALFELLDAGTFWLSDTPDQPGSRGWDANLPRIVTWTRLRHRRDDRPLLCINTHFDHIGAQARAESATLLKRWIDQNAGALPVLVMGDFNDGPGSVAYQRLCQPTGRALIDVFDADHPESSGGTFHGFSGQPTMPRIDWILHTRELETTRAAIDRTHEQGRYPSDHFPVTALLRPR